MVQDTAQLQAQLAEATAQLQALQKSHEELAAEHSFIVAENKHERYQRKMKTDLLQNLANHLQARLNAPPRCLCLRYREQQLC